MLFRSACEYLTGETPASAGGLLERVQVALTGDVPHLLVLDGLERVQAEGTTGRPRGELEDPQMRRLLRWLAAGQGTKARALVTSRFPLVDLENWKGAGHREERLDDLEPEAARAVLRGWGVKGDDATLEKLAEPLHYHALSVAVLGSYLGKLWGGDATKAPTFDRKEEAASDPKAARLSRILTSYAERLPNAERDLLARLSTFPRGVTVEFIGFLVDAGGQIAGALIGSDQTRLMRYLERLRELGLVFRYDSPQGATFTAHPFLREYFRDLLGVMNPGEIHEAVRARLAPSLKARPDKKPTDAAMLDRYEALLEHTRLAGRTQEAFGLYLGMGGYRNLGSVIGDNVRGLRILSAFSPIGSPETAASDLSDGDRSHLVNDWGLFAGRLGDLSSARRALALATDLRRRGFDAKELSRTLRNQSLLELLAGKFPAMSQAAADALTAADEADDSSRKHAHAYLACALGRSGKMDDARSHFAAATELENRALYSLRGVWEAEHKLACGDRVGAVSQTQANRAIAAENQWAKDQALCDTLLGLVSLPQEPAVARQHLEAARTYASSSGHVEIQLRCHHLAAEIARTERSFDLARGEAEAGIHLADTCGFGHYAIELRLALSRAHLDAGDPTPALERANEALTRSTYPECQYAWGEADGLHLCGLAHALLNQPDLARQRLTTALEKRTSLTHPGIDETRRPGPAPLLTPQREKTSNSLTHS